jgi:hypothetical protein
MFGAGGKIAASGCRSTGWKGEQLGKTACQLLDSYLEKAGKTKKTTTIEQANALGISAGHWSQLKNGKVRLTDNVISKMAKRLAAQAVAKEEDVIRELTFSRDAAKHERLPSSGEIFDAVEDFFSKVSNDDSLVCVDYRDFPQTTKDGPYPSLGKKAAEAIANGGSFAMFQPFGSAEGQQKKLIFTLDNKRPPEGHMYLLRLANEVRKVFGDIKHAAEKLAGGRERIQDKIVLYEAKEALSLPACGISSRMLYANYMEDERRNEKVYQWIAGMNDRDYFIERSTSSISLDAIAQQFDPIFTFWSKKKHLPRTDKHWKEATKDSVDQELKWEVWPRSTTAE